MAGGVGGTGYGGYFVAVTTASWVIPRSGSLKFAVQLVAAGRCANRGVDLLATTRLMEPWNLPGTAVARALWDGKSPYAPSPADLRLTMQASALIPDRRSTRRLRRRRMLTR